MHLALTDELVAFRDEMRSFFRTKVPESLRNAAAQGRRHDKAVVVEAQRILNASGLAVPGWPVEWGGRDWTPLQRHIWHEELQRASVPRPLPFNVNMIGPVIAAFGSQEQKERFLPATANLDIWWCQGFSEPNAGSDLASLTTRAERDGDAWVINGQKTWTTFAQHADWIFVLCRTDPHAERRQNGISMILIPMDTPGLTVRPIQILDGSYEVNEVFLDDVRVPSENMVGRQNQGWSIAKFLLGNERVGVAPIGAVQTSLVLAKEAMAELGLNDDRRLVDRVVDLENELLALEVTALRVVAHADPTGAHPASSVLKLKGTELQQAVTELLVEIAGPWVQSAGGGEESLVPRWARAAGPSYLGYRKASIYGGSNEIQRSIIARTILDL
jgi:alkylation response protein AidB-like acyl-CoA dehydrogenase